jgi:peroxiredoxin (alkyl hydroperoxide reductase subunit C)
LSLIEQLGVFYAPAGAALRATFIVDPDNVIQHVTVNNLNVGRSPEETLRILDALQTGELCACNRTVGGETL